MDSLVAADAGFVGYAYARALLDSGRHLLLRVGSNVRLLRKLGWMNESEIRNNLRPQFAHRGDSVVMLCLVVGHNGKHPIYLVTSILDLRQLTDRQVLDLYRRRWGIELFFRHLKQTYERCKLRNKNAENARVELEWSLLGLWGMALYAQAEIHKHGLSANQHRLRAPVVPTNDSRLPASRAMRIEPQFAAAQCAA